MDDELVPRIDEKAGEASVSGAQWIRMAIEAYIHRNGEQETIDAVNLRSEAVNLREEAVNLRTALEERGRKIAVKDGELSKLRDELTVKSSELDDLRAEAELLKGDLQIKEGDLSQLKRDAELKWRDKQTQF